MYHNCNHCCINRHYEKKIVGIIDSKKTGKMKPVFLILN
jgi:hypothetical protein